MVANITITSAQILAGFTTPITLVAAPGAGNVIVPIAISVKYKFVTAAYATNTTFEFKLGAISIANIPAMISQAADRYATLLNALALALTAGPIENQALTWDVQTGNPAAGGGNLQIQVIYRIQAVV